MLKTLLPYLASLVFIFCILYPGSSYSQAQVDIKSYLKVTNGLGNFPNVLNSGDEFGCSITNAGDLDGDGISDIVVGAYGTVISTGTSGTIYILYMNANGTLKYLPSNKNFYVEDSAPSGANYFGKSVANIGDIDGDGIPDLAIGAPADPSSGVTYSGDVYICFMKKNGKFKSVSKIAGSSLADWSNQSVSGSQFGASVALIGDLDGDGVNDIIVGAPADKSGSTAPSGSAFIIFLKRNGTVKSSQKIDYGPNGNFARHLGQSDNFGASVAGIGDFDGDGLPDVAVGAPEASDVKNLSGAFYILNLNKNGTVKTGGVTKISDSSAGFKKALATGAGFGSAIAYLKNFSYKGIRAFAVGAPGDSDYYALPKNKGRYTGAVWVIYLDSATNKILYFNKVSGLNPKLENQTFYIESGSRFGSSVIEYGSADNNTTEKLMSGVPLDSGENPLSGTGGFYEINFKKYELKADSVVVKSDTLCAGTLPKVAFTFENFSNAAVDSIPVSVQVSGPYSYTMNDTIPISLAVSSNIHPVIDTFLFSLKVPVNKPGLYTLKVSVDYPADFNRGNDTLVRHIYIGSSFPKLSFSRSDSVCVGSSFGLGGAADSGIKYSWASIPAGFSSPISNPRITPTASTVYILTATTAFGCTGTDTQAVKVNPLPAAVAGTNQAICAGTAISIGSVPDPGSKYKWTSQPGGFSSTVPNPVLVPKTSAIYYLTETISTTGCSKTDSVRVIVNPLPQAVTGQDTAICVGSSDGLGTKLVPGDTYIWHSSPIGFTSYVANPIVTPIATANYFLTEKDTTTGCQKTDSVLITVNPLPVANAGKNATICAGSTVDLGTALDSGDTYNWTSAPGGFTSVASNPVVNPVTTTLYLLKVTNIYGCSLKRSVLITVNPLPNAGWSAFYSGDSANFKAVEDSFVSSAYQWTFGDGHIGTGASIKHLFSKNETYMVSLTIKDSNGCASEHDSTVDIIISGIPDAQAGVGSLSLFPNPFMSNTTLNYQIEKTVQVSVYLVDMNGKETALMENRILPAGQYALEINTTDYQLKPGIYMLKFMTSDGLITQRVVKL